MGQVNWQTKSIRTVVAAATKEIRCWDSAIAAHQIEAFPVPASCLLCPWKMCDTSSLWGVAANQTIVSKTATPHRLLARYIFTMDIIDSSLNSVQEKLQLMNCLLQNLNYYLLVILCCGRLLRYEWILQYGLVCQLLYPYHQKQLFNSTTIAFSVSFSVTTTSSGWSTSDLAITSTNSFILTTSI